MAAPVVTAVGLETGMVDSDDDEIAFADEGEDTGIYQPHPPPEAETGLIARSGARPSEPWVVLIIDDDEQVHDLTRLVLGNYVFEGRSLELHSAYSGAEGQELLDEHPDAALVLLDVVMEEEDSGLSLVRYVREEKANECLQIILRTGQAGQAPESQVIKKYQINDYKSKTELTSQKLCTVVATGLRAYRLASSLIELNGKLEHELRLRRQAQKQLQASNRELEATVRARSQELAHANHQLRSYQSEMVHLESQANLSQLMNGLSHELNNPLSIILGHAQLGERMSRDPKLTKLLAGIAAEVDNCRQVLAQLERHFQVTEREPAPVAFVSAMEDAVAHRRRDDLPVPAVECDHEIPAVLGSREDLVRVLEQVLDNAVRAGAERMRVDAQVHLETVRVRLINDGETPDAETIKHAVRPFFTRRRDERPGLGLSLAAALMREMGGVITFDQAPEPPGAMVTLTLPAAGTSAIRRAIQVPAGGDPVLVVIEDPLLQELAIDAIHEYPKRALTADSWENARRQLAGQRVCALVCAVGADWGNEELERNLAAIVEEQPQLRERLVLVDPGFTQEGRDLAERIGARYIGDPYRLPPFKDALEAMFGTGEEDASH